MLQLYSCNLKLLFFLISMPSVKPSWELGEAGSKECPGGSMGHRTLFAVLESRREAGAGGGIAVASRDNVLCPAWERLAKLREQLAPLFPELGLFSGYTTVVSVIWQLSSAL